jgi:hypothetical protein
LLWERPHYHGSMRSRSLLAAVVAATALGACGGASNGSAPEPSSFNTPFADERVYPTFVSSEVTVGPNRFLVGLLNDKDAPVGSPDVRMNIAFFDLDRSASEPVSRTTMRWMWITRPYLGLYRGRVSFDHPGEWGAEVVVEGRGLDETVRASFDVRAKTSTPGLGDRVPASNTPTADGPRGIRRISTDPDPIPRLYEVSVAEALEAHKPFVVVFATPKFCSSQVCGPMLDNVKVVAERHPGVTFIHVEPYELPADAANLEPVEAALEWGLPSEPWTFVVNGRGRLVAKYEGALAPGELSAELKRLR